MSLPDVISGPQRRHMAAQSVAATYVLNDAVNQASLLAFVRGLKANDLFAGAMQQDQIAVIDAVAFRLAFPGRSTPQRFDRLRVDARSYAIEGWRAAPTPNPVFFKLLLRGGQQ